MEGEIATHDYDRERKRQRSRDRLKAGGLQVQRTWRLWVGGGFNRWVREDYQSTLNCFRAEFLIMLLSTGLSSTERYEFSSWIF